MESGRKEIKRWAAQTMLTQRKPNIFLVTALFLVIMVAMGLIRANLTEYYAYYDAVSEMLMTLDFLDFEAATWVTPTYGGVFFYAVSMVMGWVITLGYQYYSLGISRGKEMSYWNLFEGFGHILKCIGLQIVTGLLTAVGTIFFIAPGVILTCMYSQAYYILLDGPDKGVFQCMRESRLMMRGKKGAYFVLNLSFFGWYMLTGLPAVFGLGLVGYIAQLWVTPYTGLTFARYYNGLIAPDDHLDSGEAFV